MKTLSIYSVLFWIFVTCTDAVRLDTRAGRIACSAFSPDGKYIAIGRNWSDKPSTVEVFDAKNGAAIGLVSCRAEVVLKLEWSQSSTRLLAVDSSGDVIAHDIRRGKTHVCYSSAAGQDTAIAISADGATAIVGDGRGAVILDIETKKGRRVSVSDSQFINCVAISSDNTKLALGGTGGAIYICDAKSGKMDDKDHFHTAPVTSLLFSGETSVVSGGGDGRIVVRDYVRHTSRESYRTTGVIEKLFAHSSEEVVFRTGTAAYYLQPGRESPLRIELESAVDILPHNRKAVRLLRDHTIDEISFYPQSQLK